MSQVAAMSHVLAVVGDGWQWLAMAMADSWPSQVIWKSIYVTRKGSIAQVCVYCLCTYVGDAQII
jgi:hypothetical protein